MSGKIVYSDMAMTFTCADIYSLLPVDNEKQYLQILKETREMKRPHRALPDCINIMQIWKNKDRDMSAY